AAADGVRDEVEGLEVELLDEAPEVHREGPDEVAARRVLALAVPAQVGRIHGVAIREAGGDVLPVAGVVHEPVEEDDRVVAGVAPANVVVLEAVDAEIPVLAGGGLRAQGRGLRGHRAAPEEDRGPRTEDLRVL